MPFLKTNSKINLFKSKLVLKPNLKSLKDRCQRRSGGLIPTTSNTVESTCLHNLKQPSLRPQTIFNIKPPSFAAVALANLVSDASQGPDPPSLVLILAALVGLPFALWTYKSLMLVLFQRKIIYMGYAPLGARTEQLSSVSQKHRAGLRIEEVTIHSEPGVKLSGLLVSPMSKGKGKEKQEDVDVDVVVLYLQGNAGNPLHRLPVFQTLLLPPLPAPRIAVFACAPRSYWKSTRRRPYSWVATIQTWLGHILPSAKPLSSSSFSSAPYPTSTYLPNLPQHIRAKTRGPSQTALLTDYTYALHYALSRFSRASIVLYGHSLGGAAAVCLITGLRDGCASDSLSPGTNKDQMQHDYNRIRGLILENPFSSIQGMVRALYPEKWVPYRYLTSFVLDRWDAVGALQEVCQDQSEDNADERGLKKKANPTISRAVDDMLILVSENDEIVPLEMGLEVFEVSRTASRYQGGKLVIIRGALHENAWEKREWEKEMKGYLQRINIFSMISVSS